MRTNANVRFAMKRPQTPHRRQRPKLHDRVLLTCASGKAEVDGLKIRVLGFEREHIAKVREALRFIKDRDPTRYSWLIRDLDLLWIEPLIGNIGQFDPTLNGCLIEINYVETSSPEEIASVIVHEATHAQLWRRGIFYPEALRYRIEHICIRQQLAFARKASLAEELQKELELKLTMPADFWTNANLAERWNFESVSRAREAGIPDWLIKTLIWLGRARNRLRARRKVVAAR